MCVHIYVRGENKEGRKEGRKERRKWEEIDKGFSKYE